jgi:hypothetical protein
MKIAGLLLIGALPGAIAYAALTGYILNRVKPAPIVVMPTRVGTDASAPAEAIAA